MKYAFIALAVVGSVSMFFFAEMHKQENIGLRKENMKTNMKIYENPKTIEEIIEESNNDKR